MRFRLTARDQSVNGACIGTADATLTFSNAAGPFKVTSQPTATNWPAGSNQTITWQVASTQNSPVNCSQVNILFSSDGGFTYPLILAKNTPNDGSENITVPQVNTNVGRIKVEAVQNIFYSINGAAITITSSCTANASSFSPKQNVAAPAGSPQLSLTLTTDYGTAFSPGGTITAANPSTLLTIFNTSVNACATYGFNGSYRYNTQEFTVISAGTYTFTPNTFGLVYNLYRNSFSPDFTCSNFIASNCTTGLNPTVINPYVSAYLLPGKYVLVAGTFNPTFPTLPHSYSVAVTGGTVYTATPPPGAGYSYWFVITNSTTNLITGIATAANLSNSGNYPGGNRYVVRGLSYATASPALNSFVGGSLSALEQALLTNGAYCGSFSSNSIGVDVLTQYTFTGNGNWNESGNWTNNAVPPSPLPALSAITINPAGSGTCLLNVPVTITTGSQLRVDPGKNFRIMGNLTIMQ
jgi:hypothetical protein